MLSEWRARAFSEEGGPFPGARGVCRRHPDWRPPCRLSRKVVPVTGSKCAGMPSASLQKSVVRMRAGYSACRRQQARIRPLLTAHLSAYGPSPRLPHTLHDGLYPPTYARLRRSARMGDGGEAARRQRKGHSCVAVASSASADGLRPTTSPAFVATPLNRRRASPIE